MASKPGGRNNDTATLPAVAPTPHPALVTPYTSNAVIFTSNWCSYCAQTGKLPGYNEAELRTVVAGGR